MAPKLYLDYLSQPCRAIYMYCKANDIEFENVQIDLLKGEHKTEEYKKISPQCCVPCLVEGDWNLTESVAILKYLAATKAKSDSMYPTDARARARVDEFLSWQHTAIRPGGVGVFVTVVFLAGFAKKPVDEELLKEKVVKVEGALDHMENVFLKDQKYLAGNTLTMADLLGISEVMQPATLSYDVCKGRPKLAAWMERVKNDLKPHFDETIVKAQEVASPFKRDF